MRILGIIILLSAYSCVSTSKIMNAWIGQNKPTLVQTWGPPQEITEDGQGGEIYIPARSQCWAIRRAYTSRKQANTLYGSSE